MALGRGRGGSKASRRPLLRSRVVLRDGEAVGDTWDSSWKTPRRPDGLDGGVGGEGKRNPGCLSVFGLNNWAEGGADRC